MFQKIGCNVGEQRVAQNILLTAGKRANLGLCLLPAGLQQIGSCMGSSSVNAVW